MEKFTADVIKIIESIPSGNVMTYGQIAKCAGNPRGARQVSRILHSMSKKHNLPWHRVINAEGKITIRDEEMAQVQKMSLEAEGIVFPNGYQIDLDKYQHRI
ncbi:MGMT family protein [Virgibacillus siamensis]|uniref:MGMT family protein n=1 Tax=Virgibacillus siamensis TaxID=480071 RepID=UPI0009859DDA|nr:MGMT family protein [Virgibacillus siamensis]